MGESTPAIKARKRAVREQVRARLARLDGPQIQRKSRALAGRLFATGWWAGADWVFVYIPIYGEVETRFIVERAYKERRKIAIPRIEGTDLAFYEYDGRTENLLPNQFGILEPDPIWRPVDPKTLAGRLLILTPGMAFDRCKRRLGRGKGFYDRFLTLARSGRPGGTPCWAVGLAFDEQLIAEVPISAHDQLLDAVVTDREIVE
jgi:5-formyltetrahydrofolate cyclo-ligase